MRKPLLALSLALSTSLGVTQVADTMAATPAGSTLPSSTPRSSLASSKASSSPDRAVSGAQIVQTAMKYLGYPYTATGNSPSTGFSCIGFVSYVYRQNGIPLPDDLGGAYAYAPKVSFSNLMPGDIMYFQNTVWPGISHAAIYIGGGKFIHAEYYGLGVRITSFYNDARDGNYWPAKYLGANRPWTGAAVGAVVNPSAPSTTTSQSPGVTATKISGTAAVVTSKSGLNLRSKPSKNAAVITVLAHGTTVYIIGHRGSWDKVELSSGTVGWAVGTFISTGATSTTYSSTRAGSPSNSALRTVTSTVSGLRVHASPSVNGRVVGTVAKGQRVAELGYKNGWYKVRLPNGTVGWISGAYVGGSAGSTAKKTTHKSSGFRASGTVKVAANVRSGPSTNYAVVAVIPAKGSYQILGWRSGWAHVRLPSGAKGWVDGALVGGSGSYTSSSYSSKPTGGYTHRVTAGVRIHSRPSLTARVVGMAAAGTRVKILGSVTGWYKVHARSGRTGWVYASYVR